MTMFKLMFVAATLAGFVSVDRDFRYKCDYKANRDSLLVMLDNATDANDKAEIYWRLSRASLMLGVAEQTKEGKRTHFAKGMEYASLGLKLNPNSKECYMWHCANVGRECQTRSLMEQAKAVPVMTKDLTAMLDKLGHADYSEAWQALSELYYNHPLKSNEAAINFARKAATCIPDEELRISTYMHLAELLYKRNWSAGKRADAAHDNAAKFNKTVKSNIEKYSYFDGAKASMPWCSKPFTTLSDREEALAILGYGKGLYNACAEPTPIDKQDYASLLETERRMKN